MVVISRVLIIYKLAEKYNKQYLQKQIIYVEFVLSDTYII
jgi:hypothetical protein